MINICTLFQTSMSVMKDLMYVIAMLHVRTQLEVMTVTAPLGSQGMVLIVQVSMFSTLVYVQSYILSTLVYTQTQCTFYDNKSLIF